MSEATAPGTEETEATAPSEDLNLDSLDDLSGGGVTITADIAKAHSEVAGSA